MRQHCSVLKKSLERSTEARWLRTTKRAWSILSHTLSSWLWALSHRNTTLNDQPWIRLGRPALSSCRSSHLPGRVPPRLLSLGVSEPCLLQELLSSSLISSDLGGGREWGEARLYPNPLWITAACGSQSWATKPPLQITRMRDGWGRYICHAPVEIYWWLFKDLADLFHLLRDNIMECHLNVPQSRWMQNKLMR